MLACLNQRNLFHCVYIKAQKREIKQYCPGADRRNEGAICVRPPLVRLFNWYVRRREALSSCEMEKSSWLKREISDYGRRISSGPPKLFSSRSDPFLIKISLYLPIFFSRLPSLPSESSRPITGESEALPMLITAISELAQKMAQIGPCPRHWDDVIYKGWCRVVLINKRMCEKISGSTRFNQMLFSGEIE